LPPIHETVRRWARVLLLMWCGVASPAEAQVAATAADVPGAAAPAPTEPPLKEVSVAETAFVRGAPLPDWADLLPLPPPTTTAGQRAIAVRLEDTHLLVADKPVQLVNAAQQVLDAAALGQIGQVALHFIPQYQRLLLHKVALLRGGQTIDHTASVPVRFLQRETGLEHGIYSGVITASLLLPDVRVGDTLMLQYSIEGANPIFGGRYVNGLSWQRAVPVQLRRVTLNAPAQRRIRWKWVGDGAPATLEPVETSTNGMRRLRFEERDVAAVDAEPMMPRGTFALRWLQFSEFADWADVARWADALFPSIDPLPPELAPVIDRLRQLPSPAEQASQALQWVQSEVRYYSVALGESSHRPHAPAEVLRNRYGDCKDKSLLLMRMLQTLGIPARAVLASLSAPQAAGKLLASPLAFDHVIVQARIDGRDYVLDPTRLGQRGPLDRMGQGLEEARVLVVDANETKALATVRSPNRAEIFRSELNETFRLDAFGEDGELETEQHWTGLQAEMLRLTLARADPARLERIVLAGAERRYPGITLLGSPALSDDLQRNRITLRTRFKVPKLANADRGNWVLRFAAPNMQGSFASPPSTTRSFPLVLPAFPMTIAYNAEVRWPASVSAIIDPLTLRIGNDAFNAEVTRSFRGNVSRASLKFEALTGSVPARDVAAMLDDMKKLERSLGGAMVVAAGQIKGGGVLGIGRKTMQDTLQARLQSTIERTGKAMAGGQLAGDDLAQALCLRAEAELGLARLDDALNDAQEAVRAAPSLAAVWVCQGNASWARGDFNAAEAEFGKALVLGQSPAEAYYRRGHARFYAGRLEQAADDFGRAATERPAGAVSQPSGDRLYPLLWQAWTLQRLGRPWPAPLAALAVAEPQGAWPRPALAMFAGQMTPQQLLEQIARKEGDERELALTEGWFYIGQYWLNQGRPDQAREAFEQARAKGVTTYIEHTAAGFELQRLAARP